MPARTLTPRAAFAALLAATAASARYGPSYFTDRYEGVDSSYGGGGGGTYLFGGRHSSDGGSGGGGGDSDELAPLPPPPPPPERGSRGREGGEGGNDESEEVKSPSPPPPPSPKRKRAPYGGAQDSVVEAFDDGENGRSDGGGGDGSCGRVLRLIKFDAKCASDRNSSQFMLRFDTRSLCSSFWKLCLRGLLSHAISYLLSCGSSQHQV